MLIELNETGLIRFDPSNQLNPCSILNSLIKIFP